MAQLKPYGNRGPHPASWLFAIVLCTSCGKKPSALTQPPDPGVVRGDRVVVEQTAATFFEGRVLAVEGQRLTIHTPIIALSKADIIRKGIALGIDYALTVSCYQATDDGLACGQCDACRLRRAGFAQAGVADPTLYV